VQWSTRLRDETHSFRRGIDMKEWCDAIENDALRQLVSRGLGNEQAPPPTDDDDNDLESFGDEYIDL
jgi:hypothetical protein